MRRLSHLLFQFAATAIAVLAFAGSPSNVWADDPEPVDPTQSSVGGPGGSPPPPTAADPEYWWFVLIPDLAEEFPDATYDELCYVALTRHNLLPPE